MPRWVVRTLEIGGWLALAPMLGLCLTQWFDIEGRRTITAFQALTPYVLLGAAPIALVAMLTRRHPMALVALVPLATLLALSYPIVFHPDPPAVAADAPRFTVGYGNLLALNPTPAPSLEALAATDADVLVLVEFTDDFRDLLDAAVGDGDYPYRAEFVRHDTSGIAVWSRLPILEGGPVFIERRPTIDVTLDVGGTSMRLVAIHPYPPTHDAVGWSRQLDALGDLVDDSPLPTTVIGDFNGSRWHPSFREFLDRGWRDTHEVLGHGFSVSWPTDEGWLPPTFVRLDHALFGDGIAPVKLHDLDLPGSDHRGFVVTFAVTSTA